MDDSVLDKGGVVMRSHRNKSWRSKKNRASMVPNAARVGMSSLSSVSGSFFDVEKTINRLNANMSPRSDLGSGGSIGGSKRDDLSVSPSSSQGSLTRRGEMSNSRSSLHATPPDRSPALGSIRSTGCRGSTASLTSKSSIKIAEHSSDDRKTAQVSLVAPRKVVSVRRVSNSTTSVSPSPSASSDDRTISGQASPNLGGYHLGNSKNHNLHKDTSHQPMELT